MLVKLHQAKDGALFKTHRECFLHEAKVRILAEIPKLIEGGAIVVSPEAEGPSWPHWLAKLIAENAVPLRALLEAALTDTRKKPTARKAPTKE